MTAARLFVAAFYTSSSIYALATQKWWMVWTLVMVIAAWLTAGPGVVVVLKASDDDQP